MADVRDSSWSKVGEVDSSGTVRNSSWSKVGEVGAGATIQQAGGAALLLLPLG